MHHSKYGNSTERLEDQPIRDLKDAEAYIADVSFRIEEPKLTGVELEWLVRKAGAPTLPVAPEPVISAAVAVGVDGVPSIEPGGQLELSSKPADFETCVFRTIDDMAKLRSAVAGIGIELIGVGLDPYRQSQMYLWSSRYRAMREAFDRDGDCGTLMLCNTASVQVCVDAGQEDGSDSDFRRRWSIANAVGPLLTAMFANSPGMNGRATGWRSTRQAIWMQIDQSRTKQPEQGPDPRLAWVNYALNARVICIRADCNGRWNVPIGLTFRRWITDCLPRRPTFGDLSYHLTTLFPPVRPRGYLEMRMIDAQPQDNWIVPLAVTVALLDDAKASDVVMESVELMNIRSVKAGVSPWILAARYGVRHALIRPVASKCFDAAMTALARMGVHMEIQASVRSFGERYVFRGRCPADDLNLCAHRAQR